MIKGELTLQCSCSNSNTWLITVKGGRNTKGNPLRHTYFIVCGKCEAEKLLGRGLTR